MEDREFLSFGQFTAKYNLNIDFITYHAIISSIKKYTCFKNLEETGIELKSQPAIDIIIKTKKGASLIYKKFIDDCTIDSKGKGKWASVTDISNEDWHNAFSFLKWTTKDTKLRWLQYRILHSILTTNRSVSKFKENQSDLCSFCNRDSETIIHLFYECTVVEKFWKDLSFLLNKRCKHSNNFQINKNKRLILFGQSDNVYTDNICDVIILMAKFYIYRCKVNGTSLILKNFIHELYNRYCMEKGVKK